MALDYAALGTLIAVAFTLFYGLVALCDVPYQIAHRRDHPHQDAIQVAGWVSLFTIHAIWPFLWIWATLYRPDRGRDVSNAAVPASRMDPAESMMARDRTVAKGG